MRTLNLGVLAHVDAGKTTLTERLLFEAGVLAEPGSVDAGSTHTDTMALERRRGITIRAAVVSFEVAGTTVNLVDTPGHSDFIAEVERSLSLLDGAVLVVSAVEGVQAQTLVLMRALQRLGIATVVFVNKVDRSGADPEFVELEVRERLDADVPVLFGSALRGDGVRALLDALPDLLPARERRRTAPQEASCSRSTATRRAARRSSPCCDRARCESATGSTSAAATHSASPACGSSATVASRPSPRRWPARSSSCGVWTRPGSATASARALPGSPSSSPARAWAPWSSPSTRPTGRPCTPRWTGSPSRTR